MASIPEKLEIPVSHQGHLRADSPIHVGLLERAGKPARMEMAIGLGGLLTLFALVGIYSGILKAKTLNGTLVLQEQSEDANVLVIDTTSPSTFTNSLGMKMVYIPPPGEFWLGSPSSEEDRDGDEYQHKVRLTEGYYLGAHEVTRGQFSEFVASGYTKNTTWKSLGFRQLDDHPVVNVSYEDAVAFAGWLSRKESRSYSLPSEAEWEYACRGVRDGSSRDSTPYWFGQDASELKNYANLGGVSGKDQFRYTAPVGSFPANPFGLFDMHGNVCEWCSDWYDAEYYENSPEENPQGPQSGSFRVIRGNSYSFGSPRFSRSAFRFRYYPLFRDDFLGFRLRSSVK